MSTIALRRFPVARSFAVLALAAAFAVPASAGPASAGPVEELLRVAPPDAAFVLVVRDARGRVGRLLESPFAAWFPTTALGRHWLASPDVRKLRDAVRGACLQTGTTPEAVLDDVLGDAVAFTFQPGAGGDPKGERGLLLVRPAKPEALAALVERLDRLQLESGELTAVEKRDYHGTAYAERRRATGPAEFRVGHGGTFAFSTSEDEVRAFLDRGRSAPPVADKRPAAAEAIDRLGLEKAAAVLLVNPRALDAAMMAKAAAAPPGERAFLGRLGACWATLDAAALYLTLDKDAEVGLALRARDGDFLGPEGRVPARLWSAVPEDALVAVAGRQRVSELVEWLGGLMPAEGRKAIRGAVEQTLGPLVGRDKLPLVLEALGPDWGAWVEPPRGAAALLPVPVFALEVRTDGEKGPEAARALTVAIDYAFQTIRIAYNARHADQIELVEVEGAGTAIKSLVGEKAFPSQLRPSFAFKHGFLLFAGDPDAIRNFRKPPAAKAGTAEVPLFRLSATSLRAYLASRAGPLAKFHAERSGVSPEDAARQLRELSILLEPFERLDAYARPAGTTLHVAARLKLAKPLEK